MLLLVLLMINFATLSMSICRNFCGNMPVKYPFGIDNGCGAPQFKGMLNCSTSLFFQTPSGNYKVESIDYDKNTMVIYDSTMSTCSILQPHRDFTMSDLQYALIPPSSDTIFALVNCSIDSPVLNHYKSSCFNFSGHSCDELYGSCTAFRIFHLLSNNTPPCCFTGYNTLKFLSMNILDCTHYTSMYGVDKLEGVTPLDWLYGIKLNYGVPDNGCGACEKSGGSCGFDVETEGILCMCSSTMNSTRECAAGSVAATAANHRPYILTTLMFLVGSTLQHRMR